MKQNEFAELMFRDEKIHPELEPFVVPGPLGKMLHHKFIIEIFYPENKCALINVRYEHKKKYVQEMLSIKNWEGYIFAHERPYRFEAFLEIEKKIPAEKYWNIISNLWIDSENIFQHLQNWKNIWKKRNTPLVLEEEQEGFNRLPDTIQIHRGILDLKHTGLSWTLNYDKAIWFSRRFLKQHCSYVISGTIKKSQVSAVFLDARGENEIVAFPERVKIFNTERIYKEKKS